MSENVADIRPTALGKWDEQLVKNTIEFSCPPPRSTLLPHPRPGQKNGGAKKKREKVNIELRSIAFSDGVKFWWAVAAAVLNF